MDEEYYTVKQVAERFQVTRAAVYNWMRSGELPYVIVGKDRRITGTALKAFVRPGKPEQAEEEESDRLASYPARRPRKHRIAGTGEASYVREHVSASTQV